MDRRNNPAGRLHVLIRAGLKTTDPNTAIREVWKRVLGVDDDTEFLKRFGRVCGLPAEIRMQVLDLENVDHDLLLRGLPKIEQALHLPPYNHWQQFTQVADEAARFSLEYAADALSRHSFDPVPAEGDIKSLNDEVAALLSDIIAADIDAELKAFLARHARAMLAAIQEVHIGGAAALRDAVEMSAGGIGFRYREQGEPHDSEGNKLFKRLMAFTLSAGAVVSLTNATFELTENTFSLIEEITVGHVGTEVAPDDEDTEVEILALPPAGRDDS